MATRLDTSGPHRWVGRHVPMLVTFVAAMVILIVGLPNALNIPQSNPSTIAEYAPLPADSDTAQGGNLTSLGLSSSRGLGTGPGEIVDGSGGSSTGKRLTTKKCVGSPARQTEDPMSPPCVPFFEGDNGGSTYQGVTRDEITVIITDGASIYGSGAGAEYSPPAGSYCDLDKPPNTGGPGCYQRNQQRDYLRVRMARAYSRYFNSRYQTYGRHVHYWMYFTPLTGSSAEVRRADAADNIARLNPFAVINQVQGYQDAYYDALASRGVTVYLGGLHAYNQSASFFQKYAPQAWSFNPDIEHWADNFVSYVCTKVAGFPVSHAQGGIGLDGRPMNGKPRKYGFYYSDDPAYPGLIRFAEFASAGVKKCGVTPAIEATHKVDANGTGQDATNNIAKFRAEDVTTIIWFAGFEFYTSHAGDAAKYYPEVVIAGDGGLDGLFYSKAQQNQAWWRNVWGTSNEVREDRPDETPAYQACFEGDPTISRSDCEINVVFYRQHFMLFKAIQAAGPRLTPAAVDRGLHAIPSVSSDTPYVASCFFDPGDFSCVKDQTEVWWDPSGTPPGRSSPGCYRMVREGRRYLKGKWPRTDEAFTNPNDPCTTFTVLFSP